MTEKPTDRPSLLEVMRDEILDLMTWDVELEKHNISLIDMYFELIDDNSGTELLCHLIVPPPVNPRWVPVLIVNDAKRLMKENMEALGVNPTFYRGEVFQYTFE